MNASRKENSCLKTLKNSAIFSFTLMLLLLSGCSGPYNSAQTVFDACQRWTAKEMQIFFDWDDQYYYYENSKGPNVGCICEDSILKQYFYIGTDEAANLNFFSFASSDAFIATGYFVDAPDEYTYQVKIGNSQDEELLPNGTILTFTREDIAEDELFMPDVLGEYEGASPSTLLPSDSSSSNSSTS